jgi:hypothetical protein
MEHRHETQMEMPLLFRYITLVKRKFSHCFNNKHVLGKRT